jgi:hypothetical protein
MSSNITGFRLVYALAWFVWRIRPRGEPSCDGDDNPGDLSPYYT